MSVLSLRLPDSIHAKAREISEQDGVSINQFIATAVAEKVAALLTTKYLADRASRANRKAFDRILARVPSRPPMKGDELPALSKPAARARRAARTAKRRPARRR